MLAEVANWRWTDLVDICSDPYAKFSRWPTGRPISKAVNLLVYRITYWPMGRFGIWINPVANREIWCMGQPVYQVHHTNSFRQLLVYTLSQPHNLLFLLPLCMSSPCHSCCTLFSNCCIGSLSCTQSASYPSSL